MFGRTHSTTVNERAKQIARMTTFIVHGLKTKTYEQFIESFANPGAEPDAFERQDRQLGFRMHISPTCWYDAVASYAPGQPPAILIRGGGDDFGVFIGTDAKSDVTTVDLNVASGQREGRDARAVARALQAAGWTNCAATGRSLSGMAVQVTSRWRNAGSVATQRLSSSVAGGLSATTAVAGEVYTVALGWKNNSEFSNWLTTHLSNQRATLASKAMDAEYLRTHIGGSWHRLYDGGHSVAGSWKAVSESISDLGALDQLGVWANEYWKDLITTRGMPILILDHANQVNEYFKHLDSVNVAQFIGGEICGVSIFCNWNDPSKLIASATATECSGIVYANVIAPLVSLIAIGRAYFLLKASEQADLQSLITPAMKGLSRSGATILLITVIPGGFLLHLSSGIVISLAHGYLWDKGSDNKEAIFSRLKVCLVDLQNVSPLRRSLTRRDDLLP